MENAIVIVYHPGSKRTPETLPFREYRHRLAESNSPLDEEVFSHDRSRADYEFVKAAESAGLSDRQTDTLIEWAKKMIPGEMNFTLNSHSDLKTCPNIRFDEFIKVRRSVQIRMTSLTVTL